MMLKSAVSGSVLAKVMPVDEGASCSKSGRAEVDCDFFSEAQPRTARNAAVLAMRTEDLNTEDLNTDASDFRPILRIALCARRCERSHDAPRSDPEHRCCLSEASVFKCSTTSPDV